MTHQKLKVATAEIETLAGEIIPMSVLIVPSVMISDNASTFLVAVDDLQRLFESKMERI